MTAPRLVKGGLVLVDPVSGAVQRVIALQYNPDTLTRTLQVQAIGGEGDRIEALRLKGPPAETIKFDAEIDATDQLEQPDRNADAATLGLFPQLAAFETILYPASASLSAADALTTLGTLEIAAAEAPLVLFVWSSSRVVPVRITDFTITEEAFDATLNPIRAKIALGLRVLTVNDLGFAHRGGTLFMAYLQGKERLAARRASGTLATLGIAGIGA